ncbi:hypothetical protein AUK10_02055 [Candidatus Gracilibacteria bacterium CG2_30_37_12]|nr:MAG: hypothetical protein AUK10_02055 [Candidatus Gracilibacteria bacterium CG2_30_37_12]
MKDIQNLLRHKNPLFIEAIDGHFEDSFCFDGIHWNESGIFRLIVQKSDFLANGIGWENIVGNMSEFGESGIFAFFALL